MTPAYRALCAELVDALDNLLALVNGECPSLLDGDRGGSGFLDIEIDDALTNARALLAEQPVSPPYKLPEPVAEGPSDEEIISQADKFLIYSDAHMGDPARWEGCDDDLVAFIRHALARWGRPAAQPEEGDIHYAWELHDAEGDWQAGGSANSLEDVQREGNHYLKTYSQDGPHKLIIQRH